MFSTYYDKRMSPECGSVIDLNVPLQLTTFFDGEIISKKHPFLTRKWDADEDVDRKHWVSYRDW